MSVCNGVFTLQSLAHRCKERKVWSLLSTNLQYIALKLGVADQEGKGSQSVCLCVTKWG